MNPPSLDPRRFALYWVAVFVAAWATAAVVLVAAVAITGSPRAVITTAIVVTLAVVFGPALRFRLRSDRGRPTSCGTPAADPAGPTESPAGHWPRGIDELRGDAPGAIGRIEQSPGTWPATSPSGVRRTINNQSSKLHHFKTGGTA